VARLKNFPGSEQKAAGPRDGHPALHQRGQRLGCLFGCPGGPWGTRGSALVGKGVLAVVAKSSENGTNPSGNVKKSGRLFSGGGR